MSLAECRSLFGRRFAGGLLLLCGDFLLLCLKLLDAVVDELLDALEHLAHGGGFLGHGDVSFDPGDVLDGVRVEQDELLCELGFGDLSARHEFVVLQHRFDVLAGMGHVTVRRQDRDLDALHELGILENGNLSLRGSAELAVPWEELVRSGDTDSVDGKFPVEVLLSDIIHARAKFLHALESDGLRGGTTRPNDADGFDAFPVDAIERLFGDAAFHETKFQFADLLASGLARVVSP